MAIILIAAAGNKNVIGNKNGLPGWKLSRDFKRFKKLTMDKPIVMGRKTFDSLPGILPGRKHLVVSRFAKQKTDSEDVFWFEDIDEALVYSKEISDDVYIIGGGDIYSQTINIADKLEITHILGSFEGDTFFPKIDQEKWKPAFVEPHGADEKNSYPFFFRTYVRK